MHFGIPALHKGFFNSCHFRLRANDLHSVAENTGSS